MLNVLLISVIGVGLVLPIYSTQAAPKSYGAYLCQFSHRYDCVSIERGDTWEKRWSNSYQRDLVMRINRMNTPLQSGMKIAVPKSLSRLDHKDIAPFENRRVAEDRKVIIFDPKHLAWGAYDENGRLVKWGPAAGGQNWCSDINRGCRTGSGTFVVYHKRGAGCKSSKYPVGKGGAPMPHCMFFHGGFALHGSPAVPGYNASHGCVRLYNEDAKWLNEQFVQVNGVGDLGTKVIVLPYGERTAEF